MDFLLIGWIVIAVFCAMIASAKNRSTLIWFILGILFSLIAMLAIIGLPKIERERKDPEGYDHPNAKPKSMDMNKLSTVEKSPDDIAQEGSQFATRRAIGK